MTFKANLTTPAQLTLEHSIYYTTDRCADIFDLIFEPRTSDWNRDRVWSDRLCGLDRAMTVTWGANELPAFGHQLGPTRSHRVPNIYFET